MAPNRGWGRGGQTAGRGQRGQLGAGAPGWRRQDMEWPSTTPVPRAMGKRKLVCGVPGWGSTSQRGRGLGSCGIRRSQCLEFCSLTEDRRDSDHTTVHSPDCLSLSPPGSLSKMHACTLACVSNTCTSMPARPHSKDPEKGTGTSLSTTPQPRASPGPVLSPCPAPASGSDPTFHRDPRPIVSCSSVPVTLCPQPWSYFLPCPCPPDHSFPVPTVGPGQGHPRRARRGIDLECGTFGQTASRTSQAFMPYSALQASLLLPSHPRWDSEAWNTGGREAWGPPTCHTHDTSHCPRPEGHGPHAK